MPTVTLKVTDETHGLWVESARTDGVSLSEWIRRRCDGPVDAGVAQTPALTPPASGGRAEEQGERPRSRLGTPPPASTGGKRYSGPDLRPSEKKAKR